MSTNIKLSKTQTSKIIQSGCFLRAFLSKTAGPLMKVANPLAKNSLAPLGIRKIGKYTQYILPLGKNMVLEQEL